MSDQEIYFAQHLASNDKRIRDKALSRLRKWIRLRSKMEETDFSLDGMMKLWKGLFYCMWMADKPLVQEELADNIGSLIRSFSKPSQSYNFVGAFFKTLGQTHDNIDKFRIDKFLMFTRRFFRANLQYLKSHEWQYKHVKKYIETLSETVLAPEHNARKMALGFRLHFFDIFLEELARVAEGELLQKRAHNFLQPFYEILAHCRSPMVTEGVRDKVFIELVKLNCPQEDSEDEASGDEAAAEDEGDDEDIVTGRDYLDDEAEEFNGFLDEEDEQDELSEEGDIAEQRIRRAEAKELKREMNGHDEEASDAGSSDSEEDEAEEVPEADAAELHLLPIDFDMSAIKASLLEYSRLDGIKSMNRKAITFIVKKIIDLENGVNPFAAPVEDSGSDLELSEADLKAAERELRRKEKECAEEAARFEIPERDVEDGDEDDEDFEMEGGEDDLEEFERTFADQQAPQVNGKKGKKDNKRRRSGGDHMYSDSDEEHIGEIEKDIRELDYKATRGFTKRAQKTNGKAESVLKPRNGIDHKPNGHQKQKLRKPSKKKARV